MISPESPCKLRTFCHYAYFAALMGLLFFATFLIFSGSPVFGSELASRMAIETDTGVAPVETTTRVVSSEDGTRWLAVPRRSEEPVSQPRTIVVTIQASSDALATELLLYSEDPGCIKERTGQLAVAGSGTVLASANFQEGTDDGWVRARLSHPIPLVSGVWYSIVITGPTTGARHVASVAEPMADAQPM